MAFYGVFGLAMALENMEATVRAILHAKATKRANFYSFQQVEDEFQMIMREIDNKFDFICKVFRLKYCRIVNHLTDVQRRERLGPQGSQLLAKISELLQGNCTYICSAVLKMLSLTSAF
jgi:hypothetical protein